MNLSEIESALSAARKTQKIGLPVSLRVFAEFADGSAQLPEWAALLAAMARRTFDAAPQRVMARLDRGALQLSLLIEFAGGRTAALTLVRGVASCDASPPTANARRRKAATSRAGRAAVATGCAQTGSREPLRKALVTEHHLGAELSLVASPWASPSRGPGALRPRRGRTPSSHRVGARSGWQAGRDVAS